MFDLDAYRASLREYLQYLRTQEDAYREARSYGMAQRCSGIRSGVMAAEARTMRAAFTKPDPEPKAAPGDLVLNEFVAWLDKTIKDWEALRQGFQAVKFTTSAQTCESHITALKSAASQLTRLAEKYPAE